MHHLVFIHREHLHGITAADQLAAVGLADHAAGAQTCPTTGPDGLPGTLYGWNAVNGRLHVKAEEQTWLPAIVSGDLPAKRYHVGVWNDSPPKEADLRRSALLYGDDVPLGDEQWHVPAPAFLPHDLMLQDDGTMRMEPKQRYQDVCLEADRWRNRLNADQRQKVDYIDLWRFCLRCLGLNYRLPPELANHLRLIDTENIKSVVRVALKWEGD